MNELLMSLLLIYLLGAVFDFVVKDNGSLWTILIIGSLIYILSKG